MEAQTNSPAAHTEAFYRALMQHTYDVIAVVGGDGVITYVSPSTEAVLGIHPSALRGRPLLDRVHPEDRRRVSETLAAAAEDMGSSVRLAFRMQADSGDWRVMEAMATDVSAVPEVGGTILNARDVTARVTAQDEEERARERIHAFQMLMAGLASNPVLDSGDLAAASRRICRVAADALGVERASVWLLGEGQLELQGVALYELSQDRYSVPPALRAPDYPHYFRALETGRAIDAHDARTDPRTSEFREGYLEPLGIVSMLDAGARLSGRVVGVVCCEHVGERRTWTPDEVSFAGELADQVVRALLGVSRRTALQERSVAETQLRHAQKLSTIGTLTSGIAHDFNNILSPIVGYSELALDELEDRKDGAKAKEYIGEVVAAAERARELIVRILTFSRGVEQRPSAVDVRQVVSEVVQLMRGTMPQRVGIATDLVGEPVPVLANATQLHQVLMNVCTNAFQALGDGAGLVSLGVDTTTSPSGATVARITVADDGRGIDPDVVGRIFEPFFTTKPVGEGTGLGLSIARGIVEDHGGEITVEPTPGGGATFRIFLPLAPAETEDAASGH